jgi:WD40 repeat protein
MRWLALSVLLLTGLAPAADPPVTAVAFTPGGTEVVVGSQAGLAIYSWPDLKRVRSLNTQLSHIHDLAFSSNGKTLAAAGGIPARRGTVEQYRWPDLEPTLRLNPHRDLVYSVSWRSDESLATAGADGLVIVRKTEVGSAPLTLQGHSRGVLAAVFLPGDGGLLTASVDSTLRLWDLQTSSVIRTLANHTQAVHDLALRPGGGDAPPLVASVSDDRTIRFWQPTIGRMVRFARLESVPLAVAWTLDGRLAVAACKDGRVRLIDPDTAAVKAEHPAVDGAAFSVAVAPDGSLVVGGHGGQIRRVILK